MPALKTEISLSKTNFPGSHQKMKKIFYRNGKLKNATQTQDIVGGKTRFEALPNVSSWKRSNILGGQKVCNILKSGKLGKPEISARISRLRHVLISSVYPKESASMKCWRSLRYPSPFTQGNKQSLERSLLLFMEGVPTGLGIFPTGPDRFCGWLHPEAAHPRYLGR